MQPVSNQHDNRFLAGVTVGFFLGLVLSAVPASFELFRIATLRAPFDVLVYTLLVISKTLLHTALLLSTAIEVISVAFFKSSLVTGFIAAFALNMTGCAMPGRY
jgi:hypothetical protein